MWLQSLCVISMIAGVLSILLFACFEIAVARVGTLDPVPESNTGDRCKLSVVIPARNEEEDIEKALRSVLDQRDVELEVVVVNDHSSDNTGEIVRRLASQDDRITLIENPPLGAGWLGKPNAMQHGVAVSTADMILFTDADIVHLPTAFTTGLSALRREDLDLLSLCPRVVCESFWENVFIPLSLVPFIARCADGSANNQSSKEATAAGAFMLIKRDVLGAIGGVESIKSAILDDNELARNVRRGGYRVGYHLAPKLMRVRMFKNNRHAFWGATKNVLALSFSHPWMAIPTMGLPVFFFWVPLAAILAGIVWGNAWLVAAGLVQPLVGLLSLFRIRFCCSFHWQKALCFPLIVIPVVCVLASAFYEQKVRGVLTWRDRSIDLRRLAADARKAEP